MKKKIVLIIVIALLFFTILLVTNKSNAAYLEETEINLYALDEKLLETHPELEIPDNFKQEYQIKVKDTTISLKDMGIYEVDENGDRTYYPSFIINDTGLIKLKQRTRVDQDDNIIGYVYNYGTRFLCIRVGEEKLNLKVNLIDYSYQYVENQLKKYINDNFSGMTDYDKAKSIVKYVASEYSYSTKYQSWRDMYLYKCGDCWASTNLINKMCELAGIKSHSRGANRDSGSGSGHENNAILIDGKVYIADAGYIGDKGNRPYDFELEDPPYTCRANLDGTLTLLQYDGFETETLVVPSTISGKTVSTIGKYFYANNTIQPKRIVLPNTIKTIDELAFYTSNEQALYSVNIPKSVTEIGYAAFSCCKNLNINIETDGNFIIENSILYNKDKTTLIQVLAKYDGDGVVVIPNTVREIKKSSFFGVKGIKNVKLPLSIEEIAQEVFWGAEFESVFIPKSIKKIGYAAFGGNDSLLSVEIEEGSKVEICELAFARCYYMQSIKIPETVTEFGSDIFDARYGNLVIYGKEGSKAQTYAKENNIQFSSGKVKIINKYISGIENKYVYEVGKTIKPEPKIQYMGNLLVKDKDYTITYDTDFSKPGEHKLIIKGIGNFDGEVSIDYKIEKGESRFTVSIKEELTEGEILNPQISNPDNQEYRLSIYSGGYSVKNPGIPGTYQYYYYIYENDYFASKTISKTVTIKPASIPLEKVERDGMDYSTRLYVGDVIKLGIIYTPTNTTIAKNIQWSTDNKNIINLDNNGNLTAISEGTEYAYATVAGRTVLWRIEVLKNERPLESISISGTDAKIDVGTVVKLKIEKNPTNATCNSKLIWSSSNIDVIDIKQNGEITAKKVGTATITAKYLNGKTATCEVTVTNSKEEETKPDKPDKPTTVKLGDINKDGKIDVFDARVILRKAASRQEFTEYEKQAGDVNKDGKVNVLDARRILMYSAKIITKF